MQNQIRVFDRYTPTAISKLTFEGFRDLMNELPPWLRFTTDEGVVDREDFQCKLNALELSARLDFHFPGEAVTEDMRDVAGILPPFFVPEFLKAMSQNDIVVLLHFGSVGEIDRDALLHEIFAAIRNAERKSGDSTVTPVSDEEPAANVPPTLPEAAPAAAGDPQDEDGDEEVIVRRKLISDIQTDISAVLGDVLSIVGPSVWCNYIGRTKELPNVLKQGKKASKADLEYYANVLHRMDVILKDQCLIFFKTNVEGAMAVLCEDVFGALSTERHFIQSASDFIVITTSSRFDFSCPVVERVAMRGKTPQDVSSSVRSKLNGVLEKTRVGTKLGQVVFRKCDIFGIFAMFFHRAYNGYPAGGKLPQLPPGSFYFNSPNLIVDLKGAIAYKEAALVISVPYVEMTETFAATKASSAISYLATIFGTKYNRSLTIKVGENEHAVLDFYLQMVGYNPKENMIDDGLPTFHAFGMALQRARNLRKGTMMDKEFKRSYATLHLGENYNVKYDGMLASLLHALSQALSGKATHVLICLDKGKNATSVLSVISSIRPNFPEKQIRICFPSGVPDTAEGFQNGANPLVLASDFSLFVCRDEGKKSCLIWMCNPSSGNDYMNWGKVKETEEVSFSNLVENCSEIYRLTTFATSCHINCVVNTFRVVYGDVRNPYDSYMDIDGNVIPIQNMALKTSVVPIGHAPHTAQRLVYYRLDGTRGIVKMNPPITLCDEFKLDKWQVRETLAFSQNRYRLLASYRSDEIIALGLKRNPPVALSNRTAAATNF
jgi:hypothetical protein